jgi:aconitate hydratase
MLGDSITTDHISPAGAFSVHSAAGKYLLERGVSHDEFNSYGSRRGNDEVMIRGTFANVRIRNKLVTREGGYTTFLPTGEEMTVYDAAMQYKNSKTPLIILAGKEYGSGSSRDWAAKGTYLLGVRAVIAESFERIHRSNLVGMGVLPLQFLPDQNAESLGLTGREEYSIPELSDSIQPAQALLITAKGAEGTVKTFHVMSRLDSKIEIDYYRNNGILQYMLRRLS